MASRGKRLLLCCFLCGALSRVSKLAFPVPGKPHPVTGQEEAREDKQKRAKTTRGQHTPYRN